MCRDLDVGRCRNVNGDLSFGVVDLQALFADHDGPVVQNNPGTFDFNGDTDEEVIVSPVGGNGSAIQPFEIGDEADVADVFRRTV